MKIYATWHKIFNPVFDTVSFRLKKIVMHDFPLFSISNSMKMLLKINLFQEILGKTVKIASELAFIRVGIFPLFTLCYSASVINFEQVNAC